MTVKGFKPPKLASFILHSILLKEIRYGAMGEFEEQFLQIAQKKGLLHAHLNYWMQILVSIPNFVWTSIYWGSAMFANYFKTVFRYFKKQKIYSVINITGLAIGMACCLLIFLWVQDELSYDQFHEHKDSIYRLLYGSQSQDRTMQFALSPFAPAPILASEIPEIAAFTRLHYQSGMFESGDQALEVSRIYYVDPGFFDVFTCQFIHGNPEIALKDAGSVVLTETIAKRIFGSTDVYGKHLKLSPEGEIRVTAIIKDYPRNSHFMFDALVSNQRDQVRMADLYQAWDWLRGYTYCLLKSGSHPDDVTDKINRVVDRLGIQETRTDGSILRMKLQKMTDIYLKSHLVGELENNGSIDNVRLFSLIALFILLIACINFINLSTARSGSRRKEVGMRKVLGARQSNLVTQFLSESFLTTVISLFFALVMVALLIPSFNTLTGKNLVLSDMFQIHFGIGLIGLILITGFGAGSYPALRLSSFQPIVTLKQSMTKGKKGGIFRSVLVVLQFFISVTLIASTLVILNQLRYMKHADPGFDEKNVMVAYLRGDRIRSQAQALKQELIKNPNILDATVSYGVPGEIYTTRDVIMEGKPETESLELAWIFSDYDLVQTYGLEVLYGRNFSLSFGSDATGAGAMLINETAAKATGWNEDAIGKHLGYGPEEMFHIVGIVKDFHFESLRAPIVPMGILLTDSRINNLSLKLSPDNMKKTIDFIRETWKKFEPQWGLTCFFADEGFDSRYQYEERLIRLFTTFAVMAILIACMGLFGLAAFTAEQHTKEIGIRKVLGATVVSIIGLLSKTFFRWIMVANLLGWSVTYIVMNKLLQNYAYRTSVSLLILLAAGLISLGIAFITVGFQTIKASLANPVDSIKYE